MATTANAYDTAIPSAAKDHQRAPTAWPQRRHDAWQSRIDAYKANPDGKNPATIARHAINEHAQDDLDDIVERAHRLATNETLIENEPEKRRNNGER